MFYWCETLDATCKITSFDIQRYRVLDLSVKIRNSIILYRVGNANMQDTTLKVKGKKHVSIYRKRERGGCVHVYFIVFLLLDVSSLSNPPEMSSRSC